MAGRTWILLRGLAREAAHWGEFPAVLAAATGARVRCLDLPGVGTKHDRAVPLSIADNTEAVRAELAPDDGDRYLLAISLGAMVGIDWVARHPEDFRGAVFVNTTVRGVSRWTDRFRPAAIGTFLRAMVNGDVAAQERGILALTAARPFGLSDVLERVAIRRERPVAKGAAVRQLVAAARFRAPEKPLPIPTLVVTSKNDQLANPRGGPKLAAALGAAYAEHPWAGHDLPFDDPAWLSDRLRHWLSEIAS